MVDVECYFTLSGCNMPGYRGFYNSMKDQTPNETKLYRKQKFEPKGVVWTAVSEACIGNLLTKVAIR